MPIMCLRSAMASPDESPLVAARDSRSSERRIPSMEVRKGAKSFASVGFLEFLCELRED